MKQTENQTPRERFQQENFMLGVNYWPRKTGVQMWRKFDAAEIDAEFAQIREMGMDTVRVFPLWDDFQPIYELPSCGNVPRSIGMRHDWNISPEVNPSMIDPAMFEKFDKVVELAGKHQLKLIVALLTAWMSGTLFNPSWKNGRNLFSHPFMLKYQMLYCRAFAARYANRPEILAWEYGNEQNCADSCASPETAWVWLHALAAEMRLGDPATSIGSGMHGLRSIPTEAHPWCIADNADAVDFLTTHPYPLFTPGCFKESPTSLRANLHATAESCYMRDLGKRPVLCEETGSLGKTILSEPLCAGYLRTRLYSLFANNISGCLWWCYSDFLCGGEYPYRMVQMENNGLGLTRTDGTVKPAGEEMTRFREVVKKFNGRLPELRRRAAILSSDLQNDWLTVYNCFALCVQAGIAPAVVRPGLDALSGYDLLLAPSFSGVESISIPAWNAVIEAVRNGAVLYVSSNGVSLTGADEVFGIREMETCPLRGGQTQVHFDCGFECAVRTAAGSRFHAFDGEVIARRADGEAAMFKQRCGKGTAFFLSLPLEQSLAETAYANEDTDAWKLYEMLKQEAGLNLPADFADPMCERYWNSDNPHHGWLTIINHRRETVESELSGAPASVKIAAGEAELTGIRVKIAPLHAVILEIGR